MNKFLSSLLSLAVVGLLFPGIASADVNGTFTASSYCYNNSTDELSFNISNVSPALPSNMDFTELGIDQYGFGPPSSYINGLSYPYTTTSFSETLTVLDASPIANDSTNHNIYFNGYDGSTVYRYGSQAIQGSNLLVCDPSVEVRASPTSGNVTVGSPFSVDVKIHDGADAFNAARATVTVSSNLTITGINTPSSNPCNLQYTQTPTTSNPSFAGAVFGGSSAGCTVYTMTLTPNASGTGTVTFTNGSIKSYEDNSEILTGVDNASFTMSNASTPTPTPVLDFNVTNPVQTYDTSFDLFGTKLATITKIFVNGSDTNSTYPTSTTWENAVTLSLGANNFTLYGQDASNNQTATRTLVVNRHTLGDINGDGNVNLIDASLFAVDWDKTSGLTYILSDMNGDGVVNLVDLSILAKLIE